MNNRYSIIVVLGLFMISPIAHAITPTQFNQLEKYDAALKEKYAIIKEIDTIAASAKADQNLTETKVKGYSLTAESVQRINNEIYELVNSIKKIDAERGKVAEQNMESPVKTTRNWMKDGKVGTKVAFKVGDEMVTVQGFSGIRGEFAKMIDKIKDLFPGSPIYNSQVENFSAYLEGLKEGLEACYKRLNVKYPTVGTETKNIFVGFDSAGENIFLQLAEEIKATINSLQALKTTQGAFIDGTGDSVKNLKKQIAEVQTFVPKVIKDAVIKLAKDGISTTPPRSPWIYAKEDYLDKIASKTTTVTSASNTEGTFLNMTQGSDSLFTNVPVHKLVHTGGSLLEHVGTFMTQILASEYATDLKDNADVKAFAKGYAEVAGTALEYIIKLQSYDSVINAGLSDDNKKSYNELVLPAVLAYTDGFKKFYDKNLNVLKLNDIAEAATVRKAITDQANRGLQKQNN